MLVIRKCDDPRDPGPNSFAEWAEGLDSAGRNVFVPILLACAVIAAASALGDMLLTLLR